MLVVLVMSFQAKSIDFSGTYTVGATGDYPNLTAVANALKLATNTVTGNCIFEIKADYNTSSETFPIVFKQYIGSSSYSVTIRPQAGVSALLTAGSNTTAVISMDEGDNYHFDGRAGGSGSAIWTIRNTRTTSTYGAVIRLLNGASNNLFEYLVVESQNASTNSANIHIQGTNNTIPNSNNTISYCQIRNRSDVAGTYHTNGIYANGNTTYPNTDNLIDNCEFFNHFNAASTSYAIFVSTGNTIYTITNNRIFQPSTLTYTTGRYHMGIRVNNASGNNFIVSNNTIGYATNSSTGTYTMTGAVATTYVGIYLTVGTTIATEVQGNKIKAISLATSSNSNGGYGVFSGIYLTLGKVNIGTSSGNIIGDSSSNGNIQITKNISSTTLSLVNGIASASTSTVNIANNSISGITFTSPFAASYLYFKGITTSGTNGIYTITNNKIGSYGNANNIQIGIDATTTGAGRTMGIYNSATGTCTISDNAVCNITDYCQGNEYFMGIYNSSGISTITQNKVFNLISSASLANSATSPALGGIIQTSTVSGIHKMNENRVYNLEAKHPTINNYVVGIYFNGPAANSHELSNNMVFNLTSASSNVSTFIFGMYVAGGAGTSVKNYIHSLSTGSSPSRVAGYYITGSSMCFENNKIRLGIDANGNSLTSAINLYGIYKSSALSNSFYYNTVYIGGTGVASTATNTMTFYRTTSTPLDYVKNNILVNNRSNATTGGKHYCFVTNGANNANFDYNIYYANGTGGNVGSVNNGSTARTTLRLVRENFPNQELHSAYGDPSFINATGNVTALNLNLSGTTPAEGAGLSMPSITQDYEGDIRASLTPVDMGADAGNYTANDLFTPNISFSPLANTSSFANRTLTDVNLSDVGIGIPTSGASVPTIWYRISSGSATAWTYNAGTLTSGDGFSGLWSFTIDYSKLSRSAVSGDVIQYYIVAQDQATSPNIWYSPFIGANHSSVTSRTASPTTPNSYTVSTSSLSGTYEIGSGGDYPSLTGTGGFFAAANASSIIGDITLKIVSDLTETGTNALNALSTGGSAFSITIQPNSNTVYTISGGINNALIKLNGADNIYFDGRYAGSGNYLKFRNTNTGNFNAISFINGACNNKVQYCTFEGKSTQYVILFSTSTASTGNNFNLIDNNIIRDHSDMISVPTYGIYSNGTGSTGIENSDNTISNNQIFNFETSGVYVAAIGNGDNWVIRGNHFYNNLSTPPSSVQYPIYIASSNSDNCQITNNYIGGQSTSCGGSAWINSGAVNFYPIYLSNVGTTTASTIDNNVISNIHLTSTGASNFCGIYQNAGNCNIGTTNGNIIGSATIASSIVIAGTAEVMAIRIGGGISNINKNTIANITQTSSSLSHISGIYIASLAAINIKSNRIYKIGPNFSVSTTSSINGIRFSSASTPSSYSVYNNVISLGQNAFSTSQPVYGIYYNNGTGGTVKMFYNSIYILGNVSASTYVSSGFYKVRSSNVNLKNNIFYNERSGNSSSNVAITFADASGTIESDYNLLISANSAQIGCYGSTNYSFAGWKTISGKDASSWSDVNTNVASADLFLDASNGDLSIIPDNSECWFSNGNGIALSEVSTDYAGDSRNIDDADGSSDIGAFEFDSPETNLPISATQSGSIAVGNTTTYTIGGRTVATITWKSGSALPTAIDVQYFSGVHADLPSSSPMFGYTQITQTGGTNFVYDITLPFTDALLGLIADPTKLSLAKSEDGITWVDLEGTVNYTARTITLKNLTAFSYFNIISYGDLAGSTLPIELLSFKATTNENSVALFWETASEKNNNYFEVQRSEDLKHYTPIGQLSGNGTTSIAHHYQFTDANPLFGSNYYRLLSVDYDGTEHFSNVLHAKFNASDLQIYSNAQGFDLTWSVASKDAAVEVYDVSGRMVYYQNIPNGTTHLQITPSNQLATGIYMLRVFMGGEYQSFKVMK